MQNQLQKISILEQREIEALIVSPIIEAFTEKYGSEEVLEIVKQIIDKLAYESGKAAALFVGGNSIDHFAKATELWAAGDAYEMEVIKQTPDAFDFNITHCAYVDMYQRLGLKDLGFHLSCNRDFAMVKGFNPKMSLQRTMTCMEGDKMCDFRITLAR